MAIPFRGPDVRLAVLEEKLGVYEELSKEMLAKLETAVDKISEANQNVEKILVRHEERLDQTIQSDNAIMKLLEELKKSHEKDSNDIEQEIVAINTRIDELSKFRWILAGILLVVGIIAGQVNVLESMFPQPPSVHSSQ
jgi:chromosome segregation ATPase